MDRNIHTVLLLVFGYVEKVILKFAPFTNFKKKSRNINVVQSFDIQFERLNAVLKTLG